MCRGETPRMSVMVMGSFIRTNRRLQKKKEERKRKSPPLGLSSGVLDMLHPCSPLKNTRSRAIPEPFQPNLCPASPTDLLHQAVHVARHAVFEGRGLRHVDGEVAVLTPLTAEGDVHVHRTHRLAGARVSAGFSGEMRRGQGQRRRSPHRKLGCSFSGPPRKS